MKRYLVIFCILIFSSLCVNAGESDDFLKALINCSEYHNGGVIQTDGFEVQSQKRIVGFKDEKCVYEESISLMGENTNITCTFTKNQLEELAEVMNAYDTIQKYTNEKVDTSNLEAIEKNPIVKAWSKYLKDPSVCTIK